MAHIYVIKYAKTVTGPAKLMSDLSIALTEILEKPTHLSSDDMLNIELKNHLQSEYTRHRKRIEWFSFHSVNLLQGFRETHLQLLKELDNFTRDKKDQRIKAIIGKANLVDKDYIITFIKSELDKVEDYLESPWLVNKFPDELSRIGDAIMMVRNIQSQNIRGGCLNDLTGSLKYAISRIEYYIEIIGEERKTIGLAPLPRWYS